MWRLMNRRVYAFSICVLIVSATSGCGDSGSISAPESDAVGVQRQIKFGFVVENSGSGIIEDAEVAIDVPLSAEQLQQLLDVQATVPFELIRKEIDGGNQLHLRAGTLQPHMVKDVWVTAFVRLHDRSVSDAAIDAEKYLAHSRFVESGDARILALASELRSDNYLSSLRNAYDWVVENIRDEGYVKEDLGALYALHEKTGDCTEQMYLFMALSRALGVPARGVAGFVQPADGVIKLGDYHNWAEVYYEGGWRVVDPLRERFFDSELDYIAVTYLNEAGESQAFMRFPSDVTVRFK